MRLSLYKFVSAIFTFTIIFISLPCKSQSIDRDDLQIAVRSSPPFVIIENEEFSGLSVELWEKIASDNGYSYTYKVYNDLGDLLQAIENGDVDLSINPLTVTSERLTRFSFTQPYFISGMAIAVQAKTHHHVLIVLRNLFSGEFLMIVFFLFLVIFVFGFFIWILERYKNPEQFENGWKGLGHGLWWSAVTMTTVGYGDKSPTTVLGRIISVIWMFTAVIIISSFTASISASLTYNQIASNVKNLQDLKHVTVGTVKNSSTSEFLTETGIKHLQYETLEEAMDDLIALHIAALVYDEPLLSYLIHTREIYNQIEQIPSGSNAVYFGFASKNLRFIEEINPDLIEIIEGNEWHEMMRGYNLRSK